MNTQTLIYTDLEAIENIKIVFPNTYRKELAFNLRQIIGYSKLKNVTAQASLNACLNLVSKNIDQIKLLAAFYLIRTKTTMEHRNLTIVQQEISDYSRKYSQNEISRKCATDKNITRVSLVKKMVELDNELQDIYATYLVDPNIETTGTIIKANGLVQEF